MTTSLTAEVVEIEQGEAGIESLVSIVRLEHAAALAAAAESMERAIACGTAMLSLKELVPYGKWGEFAQDRLDMPIRTAETYMMLARYKDLALRSGATNIWQAKKFIHRSGATEGTFYQQAIKLEAKRLLGEGRSLREVANELGVKEPRTIRYWTDPDYRDKRIALANARSKKVTAAASREEKRAAREDSVKAKSDHHAKAYALVRKALEQLQLATQSEASPEGKQEIGSAMSSLYNAEDSIVRASKIGVLREAA